MYENVNTAASANAIPASPSLTVIAGAGHHKQPRDQRARKRLQECPWTNLATVDGIVDPARV